MANSPFFTPQFVLVVYEFPFCVVRSNREDVVTSLIEKNVVVETKVSRPFRLFLHKENVERTTEVVFKGHEVGGSSKTLFFDWSPRVCTDEFTNP